MEKNAAVIQELTTILERKGISHEELEGMLEIVHPVDLAFILEDLSAEEKVNVFKKMDLETAAAVLVELDDDATREVINGLPQEEVQKVLGAMTSDDAAATVRLIAEEKGRDAALAFLAKRQRDIVKPLLHYGEKTAGSLMTTNFVAVPVGATATEALKALQGAVQSNTVVYIYVLDPQGIIKGVLSLRTLLKAGPDARIADIMTHDMISIPSGMDQKEVVKLVKRYSLQAAPVVDEQHRMLGVVTLDSLMEVLEEEAGEDLLKMAGAGGASVFTDKVMRRAFKRIPWLVPPLIGGIIVGRVHEWFQHVNPFEFLMLLPFIPVMMGTAGNVAVQSSTLVVRGLATGELKASRLLSILWGEIRVGILVGLTCGLLVGTIGLVFGNPRVGLVVGFSMTAAITGAALNGTSLPLLLNRFGADPAISAGPFVTVLNDFTASLIYLTSAFVIFKVIFE